MSVQNLSKIKGYLISTYVSIQRHFVNCNVYLVIRISSVTLPATLVKFVLGRSGGNFPRGSCEKQRAGSDVYERNSADKNSNGEEKRGEREMAAEQPEKRGPISAFQHTLIQRDW